MVNGQLVDQLIPVGTFDPTAFNEVESNVTTPKGASGFNIPSLLSVVASAPYFHNGAAQTLDEVLQNVTHRSAGTGGVDTLSNADRPRSRSSNSCSRSTPRRGLSPKCHPDGVHRRRPGLRAHLAAGCGLSGGEQAVGDLWRGLHGGFLAFGRWVNPRIRFRPGGSERAGYVELRGAHSRTSRSSTPRVLWTNGYTELTITSSEPLLLLGLEIQPETLELAMITALFMNGSDFVGEITQIVDGEAGARLFAAMNSQPFDRVLLFSSDAFGIAQLRVMAVPEPSSLLLFVLGTACANWALPRRFCASPPPRLRVELTGFVFRPANVL